MLKCATSSLNKDNRVFNNHHKTGIRICSLNLHGFNNGITMVTELMKNHDIILLQEHWLLKEDLGRLDTIHSDFVSYSISAMNDRSSESILTGRPFGGVVILWNKRLSTILHLFLVLTRMIRTVDLSQRSYRLTMLLI